MNRSSNDIIFVFGSNKAGRHGAGAALFAMKNKGAIYGNGFGLQGSSFAIPTKGYNLEPMTISEIELGIREFLSFAESRKDMMFELTPIGCGLAGHSKKDIWKILSGYGLSSNVFLSHSWVNDK